MVTKKRQVRFKTKEGKTVKFNKGETKKRKKVEIKYPIIKEIKRNNKSRKGDYIYVKLGKGVPAREYKKKQGLKNQDYIDTATYGIISKKSGVKSQENIKKKVETKIGKHYEKLEESLGYGVAEALVKNVHKLSPYGFRTAISNLLMNKGRAGDGKPIVRDKELIEILTREENVVKYKHRLAFIMTIIGERDEPLAEVRYEQGKKTFGELVTEAKDIVHEGMEIQDFSPTIAKEFTSKGYVFNHKNNGVVKKVDVKIVFRKGRL